jgi:hypothetical protein
MRKTGRTVAELLEKLEKFSGKQKPSWPVDRYEFIVLAIPGEIIAWVRLQRFPDVTQMDVYPIGKQSVRHLALTRTPLKGTGFSPYMRGGGTTGFRP